MNNKALLMFIGILGLCPLFVAAQTPPPAADAAVSAPRLSVLPWNNHKAAVSLTFDDALPVQLDIVAPELAKRKLTATYYLNTITLTRIEEWRALQMQGNELGNHTVHHLHSTALTAENEMLEIVDASTTLKSLGIKVSTFSYPYEEVTPANEIVVRENFLLARAGWGDGPYITRINDSDGVDFYAIPSRVTRTATPLSEYKTWVETTTAGCGWLVFQMHAVEGGFGYEPLPLATFTGLLDYLVAEQKEGVWVAPFITVGLYLRAQKSVEATVPVAFDNDWIYSFTLPDGFPSGTTLKIAPLPGYAYFQEGKKLTPGADGAIMISVDTLLIVQKIATN